MIIHCVLGHRWRGCRCERCGRLRDAEHLWDGCLCPKCGLGRDEGHDWVTVDCRRKCRRCGREGSPEHDWGGCVCRRCGNLWPGAPQETHVWQGCRCQVCQVTRHQWEAGSCILCKESCRHPDINIRWETSCREETVYGVGVRFCTTCKMEFERVPLKLGH
jgi:hypothetical protein